MKITLTNLSLILAFAASVNAQTTVPPQPVPGTRMTEAYVQQVGRFAYFWAWPMVNMHNRRILLQQLPEPGLMGGIVPVAPPNSLSLLRDYIEPQERLVACPNQDVVYGFGILSLEKEPVVIQNHIGRRPIMAFGNSDGDLQMLQWTTAGPGPRFALLVHHTDAEREWAYDRKSRIGTLDQAWDEAVAKGWTIVDMKEDWKTIFPSKP
jgi:hypothetical protein